MAKKVGGEVDFQIRLANQRQVAKDHLRNVKKGFEKEIETLRENSENRVEVKDKQFTEEKSKIVTGYEDKLEESSSLTRLALNRSQNEKNRAIANMEEQFEEERMEMREKFRTETNNLIKSYREKLEAKDREMAELKENIHKSAKQKVMALQEENEKIRVYYDKKIDEVKDEYEKEIDKIYEEQRRNS